jgi:hypothetical protein
MSTSVVNVKVANIRPAYTNIKEWMNDEKNVYIGRGGIVFVDGVRFPKGASIWANPFKVGKEYTREVSIRHYEDYIREKLERDNTWYLLENLRGKCLGCWCKPEACHGDVLLKLLEEREAIAKESS